MHCGTAPPLAGERICRGVKLEQQVSRPKLQLLMETGKPMSQNLSSGQLEAGEAREL